jgi:transcriptional regulator with XRE-family HTH domain
MSFADQLRPLVERLGTAEAARICGVTPRTLQLWMRGEGNPNAATRAGALLLLGRAKHPTSR